ncbi:MAG TPA: carbon starvation CstA family protein [Dokdonella sp.]|uniref:carbon starvation CstA family protein n=1 Tax=Dokdonella sp. TaxID=2291710 RepID=UPI0025C0AF0B|nr:carbon starvation CstA family protein [Dokdonella sp.]MBX3692070.1 carbon starvation protein A [Dokdonella sp.]MCW5568964.1 carbon starvation protein A [Dokdonella sp.]HNR92442.1 carbon starvation CstA family protein [Dokdonella sp.]
MNSLISKIGWLALAILGAFCLGTVALHRGETINAVWLVTAAVSILFIAYRFYSKFIDDRALRPDPTRATPAWRRNDGLDYVPTDKHVVYGHHFAAIAGAGPLVGPVLAAQMGYLPGTLWILVGVIFAGAVQDFMVLFFSTRRDGRSLGEMARSELGNGAGTVAMIGVTMIMFIILAVLALVVVKALAESPWGTFTVAMTIPIALFMGIYLRYLRPGKVMEVSVIGLVLLMLSIWLGGVVSHSPEWADAFHFDGRQLAWMLIAYGFVASVIPIWLLLAPRDYLSTFLKIGTVLMLAIGIVIVMPEMRMPALTKFVDGTGPVFAGSLFPFLFITIACGAVSGWHSLISSGTTPKMLSSETDARYVGYGGMLMEAFVAIMALIAACVLDPGVYFAMNAPAALLGTTPESAAAAITNLGFTITPEILVQTAKDVGEGTILSRTGGAPTLAVGMAHILHQVIAGEGMMAFWYHYAILFEALFILTTVDAGTRAGRFMIQDLAGLAVPALKKTESWAANLIATGLCVACWGYFLYQGVVDPLGGINTLWPLFGIANQMLAAIALTVCCVCLIKMKRDRYVWIPAMPTAWLLVCTLTAGWQKIFHDNPKIGFLATANRYSDALGRGEVLAPAKSVEEMGRIVFNNYINATLAGLFMLIVVIVVVFGLRAAIKARRSAEPTAQETPYVSIDSVRA